MKDNNPDLQFAASELKKYIKLAYNLNIPVTGRGIDSHKGAFVLRVCGSNTAGAEEADEFSITVDEGNLVISGSNKWSVLYGVYKFLDQYIGFKWVKPGYEYTPARVPGLLSIRSKNYRPDGPKRGLVLGKPESVEHIIRIIDWMAKNGYNGTLFTFDLWECHKQALKGEIEKRGLMLTLDGHNMDLFLTAEDALNSELKAEGPCVDNFSNFKADYSYSY